MNTVFYKIVSFTLACLVLLSTLSFSVDKHYCGSVLVDVALFVKAKSCGMEMDNHARDKEVLIKKKSCCSDETIIVHGQDELKTSMDSLDFKQQYFIASLLYSYIAVFQGTEQKNSNNYQYVPPDLVRDIYILQDTFLI